MSRRLLPRAPIVRIGDRDGWICWLCHQPVAKRFTKGAHRATVDHVLPKQFGGTRDPRNLRLAHASCNEYRSGANVEPFAPIPDLHNEHVERVLGRPERYPGEFR